MKPNLIIQLQRIGDLVLTFPLAQKILELEPDRPLWIVAEEAFYSALLPLAPKVLFLPHNASILKNTAFKTILNLSHRDEATKLCSQLNAEEILGYHYKENTLFTKGFWQLYRLSLASNSRHNRFHWSDLNALDMLTLDEMKTMKFAHPRPKQNKGKIGLFLGASSSFKRPEPAFFAELALKLIHLDYKPVFLGGINEVALGNEATKLSKLPAINLVNRFKLNELVFFMNELDLFITPDTGPMHIAAAFGIPTLSLSMGNVNPYETSVSNPNHHVLQAQLSCNGCWECIRNFECKQMFKPAHIAFLAKALLENKNISSENLNLFQTQRKEGLHFLENLSSTTLDSRDILSLFWQDFFLRISLQKGYSDFKGISYIKEFSPKLHEKLKKAQLELLLDLNKCVKNKTILNKNYWQTKPKIIHAFSSFMQLYLENENYSLESFSQAFWYLEELSK